MKRKSRVLSLLLSAALVGTMAPTSGLTVSAAGGTSADGLIPADSIAADVDGVKFTHQEWTGNDYTDVDGNQVDAEDVFGINREDASASLIPYQSAEAAAAAVWDYNAREDSTYLQLLNGDDWQLNIFQNQSDFTFDDFTIYTNTQMPWQSKYDSGVSVPNAPTNYNPVGLYRKTFTVSDEMRACGRTITGFISISRVLSPHTMCMSTAERRGTARICSAPTNLTSQII